MDGPRHGDVDGRGLGEGSFHCGIPSITTYAAPSPTELTPYFTRTYPLSPHEEPRAIHIENRAILYEMHELRTIQDTSSHPMMVMAWLTLPAITRDINVRAVQYQARQNRTYHYDNHKTCCSP